ncbi:hypothetical protein Cgig2_000612 [Carnegiea gigantea]|uniref:Uncharacterized protein n=1 Tax=Carnegiea gigantea TaxID=171969 RepID=A0A9Q1GM22_9CARY|nr:hypothetical protein Cgig2_000612 [Carnegiea gigantea]
MDAPPAAPPSPMPATPPLEFAGENKESIYEECKSPTHVVKEWLPFCEEELKPTQGVCKSSFKKSKEGLQKYSTLLEGRSQMVHKDNLISNYWIEFLECMQLAGRDPDKLTLIGKRTQKVVRELKELDGGISESKISELESLIGSSVPKRIEILSPKQCHTKGSDKRLKGGKEKSMEQQQKRQRLCKA